MPDKRISIKEVAQREGVSYITALNWVKEGKIKGVQKGGRWEVLESEYQRFTTEGNRNVEQKEATV